MAEHSLDVKAVIKDFPILEQKVNNKRLAYLDSTATSQTPVQVLNVLDSSWCTHIGVISYGWL